jgi:uncharacterized RDD family membrane protein YckC
MSDSPVTVHKGGGTLAQQAVSATAPEGMLIAPIWKRVVGLTLDAFLITIVVGFLTQGVFYSYLMAWDLILTKDAPWVILSLAMHLAMYWLYFKYTGRNFGRSLGQRAMRIAIVHDDGTLLGDIHWGRRAFHKLRYILPLIGIIFGLIDILRTWRDENKRSPIDNLNHTVAAVDWSLPAITRGGLR